MDTSNKPKTVASIDINIQWPDKKTWLEETVEDHLNCVLCGGPLKFAHQVDFVAGVVCEDAHCPSCQIRNRQSTYTLQ